ncbi:MAG: 3-oxoadipyl-CoA thiolase [Acidobacteriota bacterium]|nr:3-oxoadipyl-CoA thiolase [Acidobacteriota bacterium]
MKDVFVFDGVRTAVGKFTGSLSAVRTDDMAAHVIRELTARHDIPGDRIEDVVMGCANQAGEDNRNVARMALLLAGLPDSVPGETVNRLCASGLSAVVNAGRAVALGDGDLYIAGGVEHMTRAPYVMSKTATPFGRNAQLFDTSIGWRFVNPKLDEQYGTEGMGETAENLVEEHAVSREDQDIFAAHSQNKAEAARERGRFQREIVPVSIPRRKADPLIFDQDEFIRPGTTVEKLAKLKPAFRKGGSVTAGNSSGINDGACALLIGSREAAERYGLKPMARLLGSAAVGVPPRIMGIGPVNAVNKVMAKTGLSLDQMDVIELNEAFAAQSLAVVRQLGIADDDPRLNPNGGAIAIGHPLGMTGARLTLTAIHELHEQNKRYALVTMCVGVGQGMAAVFERV